MVELLVDRVIALEGIHNLRDYGGYRARDGARLRLGRLWRSGQHCDATPDDLDRFNALRIETVIDLRGNSERAAHPCVRHPEFGAEVLLANGETAGHAQDAPHVQAAKEVTTSADAHAAMVRLYETMAFRPLLIEVFMRYFEALAERDGASLVHCLAGKDRTGVAVALLHTLLGVDDDDLLNDYLLTNTAGNIDRRIAAGAGTVRSNFGWSMEEGAVRTLMGVHPDYLHTAFKAIRARHGSIEAYARDVLGVTAERLARIEERLLA